MARKGVDYRDGLAAPDHEGADYRQAVAEARSARGADWRAALAAEHGRSGVDFRDAVARSLGFRGVDWRAAEVGPGGDASDVTPLAGAGSFRLHGSPATVLQTRKLAAGAAAFSLAGSTAATFRGKILAAGAGSYLLTGSTATLTSSGSSNDAATDAWIAAVVADGGTVSGTQAGRVNTLIAGLKTDGLFTILDRLWLYAGESDTHQAKIDIISLATHTVTGSPTLAVGGYTGNGSSEFIDTGFNPNTAGGHFTLNSASFGAYVRGTTTGTKSEMGQLVTSSAKGCRLIGAFGGSLAILQLNGNVQDTPSNTSPQGSWILSRTGNTTVDYYRNGSSVGSGVDGAFALSDMSLNFYSLAENDDGAATNFSPNQQAACFIGGGLDATKEAALSTRLNTYMTAWGVNVY